MDVKLALVAEASFIVAFHCVPVFGARLRDTWEEFGLHCSERVAASNDPKLSHGRAWRGGSAVGGKAAVEAADVTCTPVAAAQG